MYKKICHLLIFLFLVVVFTGLLPVFCYAQSPSPTATPSDPGGGLVPSDERARIPNPLGEGATLNTVARAIINAAYALAGIVALIYLILGGYQYITSSGNPDMAAQAKGTIFNSIIGLVIILCSYLIIHFVLVRIGAGGLLIAS